MKVFNILFFISLISLGFISCNEEHDFLSTVTPGSGSAKLKVIHAAPDTSGFTLKIDNVIVSGVNTILSSTVTNPGVVTFGSFFPLAEYFTVNPGARKLTVGFATIDPKVTVDLTADLNLSANKFYTAYLVGVKPNYSVILGEDIFPALEAKKTHVKFVNTVSNTPANGYEFLVNNVVVDTKTTITKGDDVFIPLDQDGTARYTIVVREKGTTTALSTLSNQNFVRGRVYTVLARGIHGSTSTTQRVTIQTYTNN
jgi:hypothetical protein